MSIQKPSFTIVLDKRKVNATGEYPIKLRVTYERKSRLYSINLSAAETDFDKLFSSKLRDQRLKDIKFECDEILHKAKEIEKELTDFSFEQFKNLFSPTYAGTADNTKIETLFKEYIEELKKEGRVSTYQSYESTLNSLLSFKKCLSWDDITVQFLNKYEKWMLAQAKSITTVGIYARTLRAIYNLAIERGYTDIKSYPFGKKKYQVPAGRNIKKALITAEIKSIFDYPVLKHPEKEEARDLWIFSYLSNGMNVKDLCRLKYENLQDGKIRFVRAKTELTTKSNRKEVEVILHPKATAIIEKWGNKNQSDSNYIFPILTAGCSAEDERRLVQNKTRVINNYMAKIGKELGITKKLTTYVARHSYSTVLKRSGVSIEFISESLGHSNIQTTESYLDSFEDETKKKYSNLLTDF
ncbi:MAG: integrase [Patiriisocius sp.]|jgi:integrase